MSGRRVYPRFRQAAPADGQLRISRDVAVEIEPAHAEGTANVISVLSDAPGVVGEELTLALLSSGGEIVLRVTILESRPYLVNGAVRHQVRLGILATEMPVVPEDAA